MTCNKRYKKIRAARAAEQNNRCFYCNCEMTEPDGITLTSLTLEHLVCDRVRGQTRQRAPAKDTVAACLSCNKGRGNMPYMVFMFGINKSDIEKDPQC